MPGRAPLSHGWPSKRGEESAFTLPLCPHPSGTPNQVLVGEESYKPVSEFRWWIVPRNNCGKMAFLMNLRIILPRGGKRKGSLQSTERLLFESYAFHFLAVWPGTNDLTFLSQSFCVLRWGWWSSIRIVWGLREIPEVKFWAQRTTHSAKGPVRIYALIPALGWILAKEMPYAITNKSEIFSGFKIIKLYFSLAKLSVWVFLVSRKPSHLVSQGPTWLLSVASFSLR